VVWPRAGFCGIAVWAFFVAALESRAFAAEIRWNAPSDCDPRERVSTQIEKLLDRALPSIDSVDFEASIERAGPEGWRLTFVGIERERGERRTRTLSGESCAALADAGAVAIAMAVRSTEYDPDEAAAPGRPSEPDRSEEMPLPAPAPAPGADRSSAQTAGSRKEGDAGRLRPLIGTQAAMDTGALPSVSPGLGVFLGVAWRSFRGEATFTAFLPQTQDTARGGGGDFALATGALAACLQPADAAVRPLACAGFEIGQLTGEGVGVARSRSGSATWTAAKMEAGVSARIARDLSLLARAGVARPFSRPEFVLGGQEVVFQPAAITFRAALGVEYSW
jgi:hypothetical protein